MTGSDFENVVSSVLALAGYWALRIPKNKRGAQPFDIIALKGDSVYAVDCKVCSTHILPLSRVEDNQLLSMEYLLGKAENVKAGFVVYCDSRLYFIPFDDVQRALEKGLRSIALTAGYRWDLYEEVMRGE